MRGNVLLLSMAGAEWRVESGVPVAVVLVRNNIIAKYSK